MKRQSLTFFALLGFTVTVAGPARAHFLWLSAEKTDKRPVVEAFALFAEPAIL